MIPNVRLGAHRLAPPERFYDWKKYADILESFELRSGGTVILQNQTLYTSLTVSISCVRALGLNDDRP